MTTETTDTTKAQTETPTTTFLAQVHQDLVNAIPNGPITTKADVMPVQAKVWGWTSEVRGGSTEDRELVKQVGKVLVALQTSMPMTDGTEDRRSLVVDALGLLIA